MMFNVTFFDVEGIQLPVIQRNAHDCVVIGRGFRRLLLCGEYDRSIVRERVEHTLGRTGDLILLFPVTLCTTILDLLTEICMQCGLVLLLVLDPGRDNHCFGTCTASRLPLQARCISSPKIYIHAISIISRHLVCDTFFINPSRNSIELIYLSNCFAVLNNNFTTSVCDIIITYVEFEWDCMPLGMRKWLFKFLIITFSVPDKLVRDLETKVVPMLEQQKWRNYGNRQHIFYSFTNSSCYWWDGSKPFVSQKYEGNFFRWVVDANHQFMFLEGVIDCLGTKYEGRNSSLGYHSDVFNGNCETVVLFFSGDQRNLLLRWIDCHRIVELVECVKERGVVITPLANSLMQHSKERNISVGPVSYSFGFRAGVDLVAASMTSPYISRLFGWSRRVALRIRGTLFD